MDKLYIIPGTCSLGIHVLANKLNHPLEIIKRDDASNYRALVPTNQVPALQNSDGQVLMEGAAIAQTCHQFKVPFVVIRSLSDIAGKESPTSFEEYLETASVNSSELVINMLVHFLQLLLQYLLLFHYLTKLFHR